MTFASARPLWILALIGVSVQLFANKWIADARNTDMESMIRMRWNYRKGYRGWTRSDVSKCQLNPSWMDGLISFECTVADKSDTSNTVVYNGYVYDMTSVSL